MSNLQVRIISALVLAAVVLTVTWFGGTAFRLLSAAIGAAILYEWLSMTKSSSEANNRMVAWSALGLVLVLMLLGYPAWMCFALLAVGAVSTASHALKAAVGQWPSVGVLYAALAALSLAELRGSDLPGLKAILFLFAVVWATDIAAYFVGRAVGGPKLAPSISPGKTQSGAIGGAAGAMLAGVAIAATMGGADLVYVAALAFVLSVVSQAGDLFESWVKRQHGAKDSSKLIPGHGGVMDRVDGLVAAALALYLIGAVGGGLDHPAAGLFAG